MSITIILILIVLIGVIWGGSVQKTKDFEARLSELDKEIMATIQEYTEVRDNLNFFKSELDKLREFRHKFVSEVNVGFQKIEDRVTSLERKG